MRRSWLLIVQLCLIGIAAGWMAIAKANAPSAAPLRLVQGIVALGAEPDGTPIPVKTFYAREDVDFYTKISWDSTKGTGGIHRLRYDWYAGDRRVFSLGGVKTFTTSPMYWWTFVHTAHFSPGHFRVEFYLDDRLLAYVEFGVKSGPRPIEPADDVAIESWCASVRLVT